MVQDVGSSGGQFYGVGPSLSKHCRYVFEFFYYNFGTNHDKLDVVTHVKGTPARKLNRIFIADNLYGGKSVFVFNISQSHFAEILRARTPNFRWSFPRFLWFLNEWIMGKFQFFGTLHKHILM